MGSSIKALSFHEAAIEIYSKLYGPNHPNVVNARGNMGITYHHFINTNQSTGEELIKYARNYLLELNYSIDHPWVKKFQSELLLITAEENYQKENYNKALELFEQILSENRLPEQSDVIISLKREQWTIRYSKAKSLHETGHYLDAIEEFRYCIDHSISLFETNEAIICEATYLQAENLRLAGQTENAKSSFEMLLNLFGNQI